MKVTVKHQVHSIALKKYVHESIPDTNSRTIITLPEKLRRWSTWDQGAEIAQHAGIKIKSRRAVDPHSAAPTRTSPDCNASDSFEVLISACTAPGNSPQRLVPLTLAWKTLVEALDQPLRSINKPRVATTALQPDNNPSRFIAKRSPLPAWSAQWSNVATNMIMSRRPAVQVPRPRVLPAVAAVQDRTIVNRQISAISGAGLDFEPRCQKEAVPDQYSYQRVVVIQG